MKYALLSLCLLFTTSIGLAQETKRLTADKHNEYGLIFSLPQTHLDLEVVATKTIRKAGPYYQYAEKYLGIPGAITQDSESWSLTSVKVNPYGVPDPEEQYLMQFKSGSDGYIVLDENGLLLSINTEPVVDTIVPIEPKAKKKSPLDNHDYAKVYSEELLMSASTAKMAEVAAKQLYRIRESRLNLVTGEVDELPADGESFKLVIQQLDEQEAALTALFMGTTQTETVVKHIDYIPVAEATNEVVFRISDLYGIVDSNNLSGAPIYLNLQITEEGQLPPQPANYRGGTTPRRQQGRGEKDAQECRALRHSRQGRGDSHRRQKSPVQRRSAGGPVRRYLRARPVALHRQEEPHLRHLLSPDRGYPSIREITERICCCPT